MPPHPRSLITLLHVNKTFLPPHRDYQQRLASVWASGWITNNGEMLQRLEAQARDHLGVRNLVATANGTVALQIAMRALDLQGDVLMTPFSYVATCSSAVWLGLRPVFVDIDSRTLSLDPQRLAQAITPRTTGIVATHVYGLPGGIEEIVAIARQHRLKVLFDAAQAFGVRYRGRSVCTFGDASVLSFHATKVFHCGEGGAVVTGDPEVARRASSMRNFGHRGEEEFAGIGINGKLSELHACLGLAVLPHVNRLIAQRRAAHERYRSALEDLDVELPRIPEHVESNYAYFPVFFASEDILLRVRDHLRKRDILTRRYFYPSLDRLPYVTSGPCPNANDVARRVLCLPLHHDLSPEQVERVAMEVRASMRRSPA